MNDGIAYLWFYESYDSVSSVSLPDSRRLSDDLQPKRHQRHPRRKRSIKLVHFLLLTTSTAVLSSVGSALAVAAEPDASDDALLHLAQASPTPRGYPAQSGYGSYSGSPAPAGGYPPAAYPAPDENRGYSASPSEAGSSVVSVQQRLAELGYYTGPITGSYDATTQQAVIQFQRDHGLDPDGIVGVMTEGALYGGSSVPAAIPPGSADPYAYPSTAPAPQYLQLNQSGPGVSELQQQLAALGYYSGSVSGVFDEATQTAVVDFQRANGLRSDGIVGNATSTALRQAAGNPTSNGEAAVDSSANSSGNGLLRLGDTGTSVSDLQARLQALGYYNGPISGSFGEQTESALLAFQQAQGLATDGIVGPQVTSALQSATSVQSTTSTYPTADPASTPASTSTIPGQPAAPVAPMPPNPASVVPVTPSTSGANQSGQPAQATGQVSVPDLQSLPQVTQPAAGQPTQPLFGQPSPPSAVPEQAVQPSFAQPSMTSGPTQPAAYQPRQQGRFSVAELQRRLQSQGFNPGEITGIYDSATQSAITQAQRAYGLTERDSSGGSL